MSEQKRPKIVAGLNLTHEAEELLKPSGDFSSPRIGQAPLNDEQLRAAVPGADALIVTITNSVTPEILDAAGQGLKVVANVGVGFNNIDVQAATERGIRVTNTPDVLTEATADLTLGLILSSTRRIAEGDRLIRSGEPWEWAFDFMWGTGLQGSVLGIIGLGRIGLAVARRARAFGMRVVASGGRGNPEEEQEMGIERVPLDELFTHSDVVSLHCPLTEKTRHLVDASNLARMKAGAYLINTARGPIVDEQALVSALEAGTIAGAGLDVFEHEPEVSARLMTLENVTLLPHLGSATREVRSKMAALAAQNVVASLAGRELITPVN